MAEHKVSLTSEQRLVCERALDQYAWQHREWWTISEVMASNKALGISVER